MLIKKIKFTDYDGREVEEEYCFHLNEAEVIKWMTTSGDYTLDKMLIQLGRERNGKKIIEYFDELIQMSYGKKSLDGRRFIKTKEDLDEFVQSEAYSVLFMELVTDAKKAADFINAIIPAKMADSAKEIIKNNPDAIPDEMKDYTAGLLGQQV